MYSVEGRVYRADGVGEGGNEVDQEAERARRRTVTGVPFFTIQNHYSIGGAEEPDAFLEIFNQIKEREN